MTASFVHDAPRMAVHDVCAQEAQLMQLLDPAAVVPLESHNKPLKRKGTHEKT